MEEGREDPRHVTGTTVERKKEDMVHSTSPKFVEADTCATVSGTPVLIPVRSFGNDSLELFISEVLRASELR